MVLGFHGCSLETYENVIHGTQSLNSSNNKYDWLGNGIYFWQNSYNRALEWAESRYHEDGRVVGAVLDLGYCLNLLDYGSTEILQAGYELLKAQLTETGEPMPVNVPSKKHPPDIFQRDLDCAVIQTIHRFNHESGRREYDSVLGAFTEGETAFPGSAFRAKTHIQICVVNPNCIKGYFRPLEYNPEFMIP